MTWKDTSPMALYELAIWVQKGVPCHLFFQKQRLFKPTRAPLCFLRNQEDMTILCIGLKSGEMGKVFTWLLGMCMFLLCESWGIPKINSTI